MTDNKKLKGMQDRIRMILDTDSVAAELVRDADRGDVHLALTEHLIEREFGGFILAEIELDTFGDQPLVTPRSPRRRSRCASWPPAPTGSAAP